MISNDQMYARLSGVEAATRGCFLHEGRSWSGGGRPRPQSRRQSGDPSEVGFRHEPGASENNRHSQHPRLPRARQERERLRRAERALPQDLQLPRRARGPRARGGPSG